MPLSFYSLPNLKKSFGSFVKHGTCNSWFGIKNNLFLFWALEVVLLFRRHLFVLDTKWRADSENFIELDCWCEHTIWDYKTIHLLHVFWILFRLPFYWSNEKIMEINTVISLYLFTTPYSIQLLLPVWNAQVSKKEWTFSWVKCTLSCRESIKSRHVGLSSVINQMVIGHCLIRLHCSREHRNQYRLKGIACQRLPRASKLSCLCNYPRKDEHRYL